MESENKSKDDFTCPICMYIMIQPVTMPCKHSLCMMCYEQCVQKASLTCPICRLRIAVWARRNAKTNSLVDKEMWKTIQLRFPVEVKNRIEGKESSDDNWDSPSYIETEIRKIKELSAPGEIRQEYEVALAQLEKQREEEAKKEEEESAALIRALQEEEEEELSKLMNEREETERLGRLAAEHLDQVEVDSRPRARQLREASTKSNGNSSRGGNNNKPKRCESASLKLDSFFNSYRKSSNSAPPYSELATTLTHSQEAKKETEGSKSKYSPYPYQCISPSDKRKASPSFPSEVANQDHEEEQASCLLHEHSYTSASAERIDLDGDCELTTILRDDVQKYVKTEPPDVDDEDPFANKISSQSTKASQTFQPISSSLRTPPKKLPSGEVFDPELIRTIPRSLTFGLPQLSGRAALSPSTSSCSSEIYPDLSSDYTSVENNWRRDQVVGHNHVLTRSPSTVSLDGMSGEKLDDYQDYNSLSRKVVYGTSKHIRKRPASSTCSLPHSAVHSSPSSTLVLEASSKNSPSHKSPSPSPKTTVSESLSLKCVNNNVIKDCDPVVEVLKESLDYFITDDTELIIPLESDIQPSSTSSSNGMEVHDASTVNGSARTQDENSIEVRKLDVNSHQLQNNMILKQPYIMSKSKPTVIQKKRSSSKTMAPPSSPSIRDWCMASKRKVSSDSSDSWCSVTDSSKKTLALEEADHLMALELQRKFSELDKKRISVDRAEGSGNEYSFRKKRKLR